MAEVHTIEDLNKRVLYRIAKVLYFGALFLILIGAGVTFYESSIEYPMNEAYSHITCANDGPITNILKSSYGITGASLTHDQKMRIAKEICGVVADNTIDFTLSDKYGLTWLSRNPYFIASPSVMEEKVNMYEFFKQMLITVLVVVGTLEIIRHVFYYVFFGTFRPKKRRS